MNRNQVEQINEMASEAVMDQGENSGNEKVARIRDILFGDQIRAYSQQFDNVNRDSSRLTHEIERLEERLQTQQEDFNQQLRVLEKKISERTELVEIKQSQQVQEMQRSFRQGNEEIRRELREITQQINHDMTDRKILGELLIQLGSSLKTGNTNLIAEELFAQLEL